jgi:hypothetical protein
VSKPFEQTKAVIELYIRSSDSFIKLALAVLAASVAFPTKDWPAHFRPPTVLLVAWATLSLSVAAGCLYQYLAIHLLDSLSDVPGAPGLLARWIPKAGYAYGTMMIFFYIGTVLALAGISQRLLN